ncbi:S-layer homology domain-containing protein [Rossellomorea aquimaris]|uniref:S-layer homology domain-containing protein n=1 Tax=Rossellomorea aquimaris TaxID=189382 RepID=UPI001CFC669F|nr:S-layer homology domain-containing protein [Rossellomorea aquimaris]
MAYQSKSNRKFLATSLTAAMVASAVAPAASAASTFPDVKEGSFYYEYVSALAEAGIIDGRPDGSFDLGGKLNRAEAAKMISKIIKLDTTDAPASSFEDVKEDVWYTDYINALYAEGLIDGVSETMFAPNQELTRAQLAKMVVEAYGLELDASAEHPFTDVKEDVWYTDYIKTLYKHDLITGKTATTFAPNEPIKRADFAKLLTEADWAVGDTLMKPAAMVEGVSATNATTLTITGEGLGYLKAEDITVEGNKVKSVTASADGKSATVVFENGFALDTEQTLSVKMSGETKEFKFKYSFTVDKVELDEKTFDDDTAGQVLSFKVNGAEADTEYLRQAGFTVKYVAVDNSTGVAATDFFKGTAATSSTGLLDDEIPAGKYTVEIQVLKDGKLVVSDTKTITVTDIESTVTAIDSVELTAAGSVVLNSNTLVTGETANITYLVGDAAGKSDISLPVTSASLSSSDPSVVSVSGQTLTANVAGSATVTVKVGNVTKVLNITVKNAAREVAKITPSENNVKLVQGITRTIDVTALDQYGDPVAVAAGDITEDLPKDSASVNIVSVSDNTTTGTELLTSSTGSTATGFDITASSATKGNGTVLFKDPATGKVLGQIAVSVTDVDNVASTKVEYAVTSAGTTNSFGTGASKARVYQVAKYNTQGAFNGLETVNTTGVAAGELYVYAADNTVASVTASGTGFTVQGLKAGSTDIVLKDGNGLVKHKFTVTISKTGVAITKVNFESNADVNYAGNLIDINDVLDVRPDGALDEIVYGVEHSSSTIAKVRLDATSAAQPLLYIDNNGDGDYVAANDTLLGAVTAEVLTGASGTMSAGSIDLAPGSYTTAATDKGSILVRVIVDANGDSTFAKSEAIATNVINVNVK